MKVNHGHGHACKGGRWHSIIVLHKGTRVVRVVVKDMTMNLLARFYVTWNNCGGHMKQRGGRNVWTGVFFAFHKNFRSRS